MDEISHRLLTGATGDLKERVARARRARSEVDRVTATSRSRDGRIEVTVGARGELTGLALGPDAFTGMTARKLSRAIVRLSDEAAAAAAGRVKELTDPLLTADAAGGDLLPNPADAAALLNGAGLGAVLARFVDINR